MKPAPALAEMAFGSRLTICPAKRQANKVVCAGQEAGLTIPRRMPSGPTAQFAVAREEIKM
jgi:hypothetical protein